MWTIDSLSYNYRKKLTIDHTKVGATLTNFPVLVKLTDARFDWTHSNSDGFDVRFTASDGSTLLKYERERHDGADYAEYWVKIPSVSSTTDTDFYIYYRTTDTADGADPTNVWDADFKAVYHLKDLTTSTIEDSTSQNNDGTKDSAGNPAEADAKIGKGQDFSSDKIAIANEFLNGFTKLTVSFWIYADSAGTYNTVFSNWGSSDPNITILFESDSSLYCVLTDPEEDQAGGYFSTTLSAGWNKIDFVWDGGDDVLLYKNGAYVETIGSGSSTMGALRNTTHDLWFGKQDGFSRNFDGKLDEVRFSNNARTADWLEASYNSEADTLLTYGAEETSTAYTQTCSETLSLTDTISRSTHFNKSISETLSMTEAVSKSQGMSKTLTETLSLSDAISSVIQKGLLLLETLHITDTLQKTTRFAKTLTESISLTDTLASAKQFFVNLSETIGLTDVISKSTNFAKTLSETLHLTDVIKVTGWFWNYLFKRTSSYDYKSKSTNTWDSKSKSKNTWTYKDK